MATIIRDPRVFDNIREVDLSAPGCVAEARMLYEDGYLVILRNRKFDADFKFLNALDFDFEAPEEIQKKLKKFQAERFLALGPDSTTATEKLIIKNVFSGDYGKLAHFQQQIRSINGQADALYQAIFPDYEAYKKVYTWRFTETLHENLHWDNFHIPENFHQVRIFTNLARSSRLWRVSHQIDTYAGTIYEKTGLARFAGDLGDDLVLHINNKVLGGMKTPCLDRLPKHHIAFDQGDIWLCETRIVSHQIYYGEKAFAVMFFSRPEDMETPSNGFEQRIARLHATKQQALAHPA